MADSWYAVQTQHRKELYAEQHLVRQGYEVYLPLIKEARRSRGKEREVIVPLFPRYLFVQLDVSTDNTSPIRSTRGVTGLVRFGTILKPLDAVIIDQLKAAEDEEQGVRVIQPYRFKRGDKVVITDGPFTGAEAIYKAKSGQERVIVLMDLLGKQTPTVLAGGLIELAV